MTRCQAAQDSCVNRKNVSIISSKACEVLQWARPGSSFSIFELSSIIEYSTVSLVST